MKKAFIILVLIAGCDAAVEPQTELERGKEALEMLRSGALDHVTNKAEIIAQAKLHCAAKLGRAENKGQKLQLVDCHRDYLYGLAFCYDFWHEENMQAVCAAVMYEEYERCRGVGHHHP